MAYQLVYTSNPKSLVIGRTGFSTVARTKDMPEKLASAVERCGVYDINKGEIFSHQIIQYSGNNYHILTRMCDAGVDYTNRNNYIAHHIVLDESEIEELANPAEILTQWSGWLNEWKGDPRFIGEPEGLKSIKTKNSLPAKTWKKYFDAPSKAALLFNEHATIVASIKDARVLLNLFSESMLLNINPNDAWLNTFTTSFSTSENPSQYMWRAVSEAENASINLITRTSQSVPDSRAAQYATSGQMNNRERLNLKVKAPVQNINFKVMQTESQKDLANNKIIYIASAICTFIALGFCGYIALDFTSTTEDNSNQGTPKPLPTLQIEKANENSSVEKIENDSKVNEPQKSLLETMNLAREKIENDEYLEALKVWDASPHAQSNSELREDLLNDIGSRIDSLLRAAESELALDSGDQKAIEILAKVRNALDINGINRKETRLAKWKNLNDKIKK